MRIGVPAYFHPVLAPQDWVRLQALPQGSLIVVNPASGPGAHPDAAYPPVLRRPELEQVVTLGYVDTAYGARSPRQVLDEVAAHQEWYGVQGAFLDQVASGEAAAGRYAEVLVALREAGLGVVLNPGQPQVDPRLSDLADHVVTFEGPLAQYLVEPPDGAPVVPPGRTWHLVYEVTAADLPRVEALASQRGASTLFVTDGQLPNPWDHLPPYWDELVQHVSR